MRRIFKYALPIMDQAVIPMPLGAEVLTVQVQSEFPMLWALVPQETDEKVDRVFHVYGTGNPIYAENLDYIGTFQMRDGLLVFHVFEERPIDA